MKSYSACTIKLCGILTVENALVKDVYCVIGCSTILLTVIFHFSVPERTLLIIIIIISSSSSSSSSSSIIIRMSLVTALFFLVFLLNQR